MTVDRGTLIVVLAAAAAAPLLVDIPARVRAPTVVIEILLGIVLGPHVLGLARPDQLIEILSQFGLAFLFFLAGTEIDFEEVRGWPLALAARGWGLSLAIGMVAAALLYAAGVVGAPVLVGLALSTTALGALVPILKDSGLADGRLGTAVTAAGAVGEFGPVVALSVILAIASGQLWRTLLLLLFAAVAVATGALAFHVRPERVLRVVEQTMNASGQLAVRLAILLLGGLVVLAATLGLDIVLGAFSAGLIVGLIARGDSGRVFYLKLDAIGYGFLIPIFFIATGLSFDLDSLLSSATSLILVPGFACLFLLTRGTPAWLLYRRRLPSNERNALALFSGSALPLVVAITTIAVQSGKLSPQDAVSLVGAAMLSLLLFPILATRLAAAREPAVDRR